MRPQVSHKHGTSLRAILVGIPLVVGISYIVAHTEMVVQKMQIAISQFAPAAIGTFFFVVIVNRLLAMASRKGLRFHLRADELVVVYVMVCIGAFISSRGLAEVLLPGLVTPNYFANVANRWAEKFFPHIKPWLVPFDPSGDRLQKVAVRFYEGLRSGEFVPWLDWLLVLLRRAIIIGAIYFAYICIAAIFRKQWVEHEKLTFPLTLVPLELAKEDGFSRFFRSRIAWAGIAIPMVVHGINFLHANFPVVPEIKTNIARINDFLTSRPWNAIAFTPVWLSYGAVGISYFLPSDLLFSLWFFFWFVRLQDVVVAAFGMEIQNMPLYPTHLFVGYQVMGAYFVLAFMLFRWAWPHIKRLLRATFGPSRPEEEDELLPPRWAVLGLLVSLLLAIGWCTAAGVAWWLAAIEVFVYLFVVVMIMARSVAEGGLLMCETSFRPVDIFRMLPWKEGLTLQSALGAKNLVALAFPDVVYTRDLRGLILTPILDGLKMADEVNMRRRALLAPIAVAIVVGCLAAFCSHLWINYKYGNLNLYGYPRANSMWVFSDVDAALEGQTKWTLKAPVSFAVGVAFTLFLAYMRANFWWWPLHPLGYALSASWTMIVFWFPILIGWVLKTAILRYGGLRIYDQIKPFFLGLIFGEFGAAVLIATACAINPNLQGPWFPIP